MASAHSETTLFCSTFFRRRRLFITKNTVTSDPEQSENHFYEIADYEKACKDMCPHYDDLLHEAEKDAKSAQSSRHASFLVDGMWVCVSTLRYDSCKKDSVAIIQKMNSKQGAGSSGKGGQTSNLIPASADCFLEFLQSILDFQLDNASMNNEKRTTQAINLPSAQDIEDRLEYLRVGTARKLREDCESWLGKETRVGPVFGLGRVCDNGADVAPAIAQTNFDSASSGANEFQAMNAQYSIMERKSYHAFLHRECEAVQRRSPNWFLPSLWNFQHSGPTEHCSLHRVQARQARIDFMIREFNKLPEYLSKIFIAKVLLNELDDDAVHALIGLDRPARKASTTMSFVTSELLGKFRKVLNKSQPKGKKLTGEEHLDVIFARFLSRSELWPQKFWQNYVSPAQMAAFKQRKAIYLKECDRLGLPMAFRDDMDPNSATGCTRETIKLQLQLKADEYKMNLDSEQRLEQEARSAQLMARTNSGKKRALSFPDSSVPKQTAQDLLDEANSGRAKLADQTTDNGIVVWSDNSESHRNLGRLQDYNTWRAYSDEGGEMAVHKKLKFIDPKTGEESNDNSAGRVDRSVKASDSEASGSSADSGKKEGEGETSPDSENPEQPAQQEEKGRQPEEPLMADHLPVTQQVFKIPGAILDEMKSGEKVDASGEVVPEETPAATEGGGGSGEAGAAASSDGAAVAGAAADGKEKDSSEEITMPNGEKEAIGGEDAAGTKEGESGGHGAATEDTDSKKDHEGEGTKGSPGNEPAEKSTNSASDKEGGEHEAGGHEADSEGSKEEATAAADKDEQKSEASEEKKDSNSDDESDKKKSSEEEGAAGKKPEESDDSESKKDSEEKEDPEKASAEKDSAAGDAKKSESENSSGEKSDKEDGKAGDEHSESSDGAPKSEQEHEESKEKDRDNAAKGDDNDQGKDEGSSSGDKDKDEHEPSEAVQEEHADGDHEGGDDGGEGDHDATGPGHLEEQDTHEEPEADENESGATTSSFVQSAVADGRVPAAPSEKHIPGAVLLEYVAGAGVEGLVKISFKAGEAEITKEEYDSLQYMTILSTWKESPEKVAWITIRSQKLGNYPHDAFLKKRNIFPPGTAEQEKFVFRVPDSNAGKGKGEPLVLHTKEDHIDLWIKKRFDADELLYDVDFEPDDSVQEFCVSGALDQQSGRVLFRLGNLIVLTKEGTSRLMNGENLVGDDGREVADTTEVPLEEDAQTHWGKTSDGGQLFFVDPLSTKLIPIEKYISQGINSGTVRAKLTGIGGVRTVLKEDIIEVGKGLSPSAVHATRDIVKDAEPHQVVNFKAQLGHFILWGGSKDTHVQASTANKMQAVNPPQAARGYDELTFQTTFFPSGTLITRYQWRIDPARDHSSEETRRRAIAVTVAVTAGQQNPTAISQAMQLNDNDQWYLVERRNIVFVPGPPGQSLPDSLSALPAKADAIAKKDNDKAPSLPRDIPKSPRGGQGWGLPWRWRAGGSAFIETKLTEHLSEKVRISSVDKTEKTVIKRTEATQEMLEQVKNKVTADIKQRVEDDRCTPDGKPVSIEVQLDVVEDPKSESNEVSIKLLKNGQEVAQSEDIANEVREEFEYELGQLMQEKTGKVTEVELTRKLEHGDSATPVVLWTDDGSENFKKGDPGWIIVIFFEESSIPSAERDLRRFRYRLRDHVGHYIMAATGQRPERVYAKKMESSVPASVETTSDVKQEKREKTEEEKDLTKQYVCTTEVTSVDVGEHALTSFAQIQERETRHATTARWQHMVNLVMHGCHDLFVRPR